MDKLNISKLLLKNISKTALEVKGISIYGYVNQYGLNTMDLLKKIQDDNGNTKDYGFHYIVASRSIMQLVEDKYQIVNSTGKQTYISSALYGGKPETGNISILLCMSDSEDYEETEKLLINLIVTKLREHKLKAIDVWRGYDLSKEDKGPLHMLDKAVFKKYITQLEKYVPPVKEGEDAPEINDSTITFVSPFLTAATNAKLSIGEYIKELYKQYKDDINSYAKNYEPWDKDRSDIRNASNKAGDATIEGKQYPTGNTLSYTVTQEAPQGSCDCVKASDKLEGIETTKETMVEPIYPDIIVPPGGEIQVAVGTSETAIASSSNTPLTVEEFEKRQKRFSLEDFDEVSKETTGRPINCDDEFPVDEQIKKLEEHYPKVKIDKTTFNFKEDNHIGSEISQYMAKNYAMIYDMIADVSRRTEQRLVKIENNLSTVMRNLFRVSSRMQVNCVYYGGQSVYGKYKCIRCLHDNRVNDGAIVSLDQCLSCTRYEPILGQVYAILDETGTNVSQVIDDLQMAYMNLGDFNELNNINEYITKPDSANLMKDRTERPVTFAENKWKDTKKEADAKGESLDNPNYVSGFKMDWNPTLLETQSPAINEYEIEQLQNGKTTVESENQGIDRDLFVDSRQKAVEYEKLEFNIKDYEFDNFGSTGITSSSGGGILGGMGATDVRNKIVEYAKNAVKLCSEGKAAYSQSYRYNHMDKAINGFHYWDCSSLVQGAYEAGGISGIGTYTANMYPYCMSSQGGILFGLDKESEALPGDMVWFKEPPVPTDNFEAVNYGDTNDVHHIALYIGNGEYAHASYDHADSRQDIVISKLHSWNHVMCFGRPKVLIDLDQQASMGSAGVGHWDKAKHGITEEWWEGASVADGNAENLIANMQKYGYKDALKRAANEKGIDPYLVAALASVESGGDPTAGGPDPGIMQCSIGYSTTDLGGIEDNFKRGIDMFFAKKGHLINCGWKEDNIHVLVSAYNSGEGSVANAAGNSSSYPMPTLDLATCTITTLGTALYNYMSKYLPSWGPNIRKYYSTKVMRAYLYLYDRKVLD